MARVFNVGGGTGSQKDLVKVLGSGLIDLPETLGDGPYTIEFTEEDESPITASEVTYTNTTSGLSSTNAQAAIDELAGSLGDVGSILDQINGEAV